ncbi:MAG: carboxyltransferase domain-containing protein [Planctomycetales bacterium]|nr:carboxyltransferase domain-containing protein [Planctomycetales bacterium]
MFAWHPLSCEGLYVSNFHDEFLLLRRQDNAGATTLPVLGQRLLNQQFDFVDDVIATEVEICIRLNPHFVEAGFPTVLAELTQVIGQPQANESLRVWHLPICFSSADADAATAADEWSSVEQASRLAREDIIERLLQSELRLAMFGFLPGFAYLSGLPAELHIPRKSNPTTRTRRNAVALGGKYLGVYSLPSPAGWHVVGELGVNLLRYDRLPPIAIQPGDRVRLERINSTQMTQLQTSLTTLSDYNLGVT